MEMRKRVSSSAPWANGYHAENGKSSYQKYFDYVTFPLE